MLDTTAPTKSLPPLPLDAWEPTKDTLHLYLQIVGKIQLDSTPARNHWWNVTLLITPRGLTTHRMYRDGVHFQIDFDFIDHQLVIVTSRGDRVSMELRDGLSVADFYQGVTSRLNELGIHPHIRATPFGVPMTTRFAEDTEHASYDRAWVERFWHILLEVDSTFQEFAGWFSGKSSPVHLFWHSFDLVVARFSGQRVPVREDADRVTQEAYSHEIISFGFWAGDKKMRHPMFYSYTAPEPPGLAEQPLRPDAARWQPQESGHLALLAYDDIRSAESPRDSLLAFLQSAYDAGSTTAGWNKAELESIRR